MVKRVPNSPAPCVGYVRVSTARQARGGVSLEAQAASIPNYCEQHGLRLLEVHRDEGRSGRTADRPGLQAAIDQVQQAKGVLLVPSVSRFARSMRDLAALTQRLTDSGVPIVFIKENADTRTPHGRFMVHMLGALAELEVEQTRDRVLDGMDEARSRGWKLGGAVPYGYQAVRAGQRRDGRPIWKLRRHQGEQAVVRQMVQLRAQGLGYHAVAARLAADGVLGRSGKPLNVKSVYTVLQRELASKATGVTP